MSFNFYYQILDGDSSGRPAKIEETTGSNTLIPNPDFNNRSYSGMYYVANSPFSEVISILNLLVLLYILIRGC